MTKLIHGKVRGRTIELADDLGLAEGQEVEIAIRAIPGSDARKVGEGLLRTEGALADDPEWDAIMEKIYHSRKLQRRVQLGEP